MWGGNASLVFYPFEIQFKRIFNNIARMVSSSLLNYLKEVAEQEVARISLIALFVDIAVLIHSILIVEDLVN